jgi:hypothetical protein
MKAAKNWTQKQPSRLPASGSRLLWLYVSKDSKVKNDHLAHSKAGNTVVLLLDCQRGDEHATLIARVAAKAGIGFAETVSYNALMLLGRPLLTRPFGA